MATWCLSQSNQRSPAHRRGTSPAGGRRPYAGRELAPTSLTVPRGVSPLADPVSLQNPIFSRHLFLSQHTRWCLMGNKALVTLLIVKGKKSEANIGG